MFIPWVSIKNIAALIQIMAWHRPGDKPLSEPMMASLLMHIYITQPQGVNELYIYILYKYKYMYMDPGIHFVPRKFLRVPL